MEQDRFDEFIQRLHALDYRTVLPDFPIDVPKAFEFTAYTGVHPTNLTHPRWWELRIAQGRALWTRPKTDNPSYPGLPNAIREWAADFVQSLPPDHCNAPKECGPLGTMPLTRACQRVAVAVGFPRIALRTMRHQYFQWLADNGASVDDIVNWGNCTVQTAMVYLKRRQPSVFEKRVLSGEL
jgi:hypothetical protein